jgi:hypothetical protein
MKKVAKRSAVLLACGCCALSIFLAGCGDDRPKRVPVSGRVTIDGKPLEVGFVQFVPENDRAATGKIDSSGRFTLSTFDVKDGCVLGKHNVTVVSNQSLNPTTTKWFAPKKYMIAQTSGLQFEITGPRDDLEIKLSWEGGKPFTETFQPEGVDRR